MVGTRGTRIIFYLSIVCSKACSKTKKKNSFSSLTASISVLIVEVYKHLCYCGSELIANLDRQVKSQSAGASRKELEDMKSQMEKSMNNLIFENLTHRNVCEYVKLSKVTGYSSSQQASPLRELSCHMGSHGVTCHVSVLLCGVGEMLVAV